MLCWIPSGHLVPHGQVRALRQLRAHHRQISLESQSKVLPVPPRLVQLQLEGYRFRMRQARIAEQATQQLRSSQHTRMLSLESRKLSEYAPSKSEHHEAGLRGRASAGKSLPTIPTQLRQPARGELALTDCQVARRGRSSVPVESSFAPLRLQTFANL